MGIVYLKKELLSDEPHEIVKQIEELDKDILRARDAIVAVTYRLEGIKKELLMHQMKLEQLEEDIESGYLLDSAPTVSGRKKLLEGAVEVEKKNLRDWENKNQSKYESLENQLRMAEKRKRELQEQLQQYVAIEPKISR